MTYIINIEGEDSYSIGDVHGAEEIETVFDLLSRGDGKKFGLPFYVAVLALEVTRLKRVLKEKEGNEPKA